MDRLSTFFERETLKKEWFCVIAEIVCHRRDCSVEELAEYISGRGCLHCGDYVFGPRDIPVTARTTEDWVLVIEEMTRAGLAVVVDDYERQKVLSRYHTTCAALTPRAVVYEGSARLTEQGYQYWSRYTQLLPINEDYGVSTWDADGNLLVFNDCLEKFADACPVGSEECPLLVYEGEPRRQVEIGNQGATGCTIQECGPFWIDPYAVCEKGFVLRCCHEKITRHQFFTF